MTSDGDQQLCLPCSWYFRRNSMDANAIRLLCISSSWKRTTRVGLTQGLREGCFCSKNDLFPDTQCQWLCLIRYPILLWQTGTITPHQVIRKQITKSRGHSSPNLWRKKTEKRRIVECFSKKKAKQKKAFATQKHDHRDFQLLCSE